MELLQLKFLKFSSKRYQIPTYLKERSKRILEKQILPKFWKLPNRISAQEAVYFAMVWVCNFTKKIPL